MEPLKHSSPQNMGDLPNNLDLQNPEKEEHVQEQEQEEEAEEALSLCDFALHPTNNNNDSKSNSHNTTPRSRSEPTDFFEFFSDFSSEMSPADDIIFCGKLIPFKEQQQQQSRPIPQTPTNENQTKHKQTSLRRRSESLSKLQTPITRSNSTNTKLMRNSKSLDYRKLHPASNSMISSPQEIERNSSVKSVGKSDTALKKVASASRPRWYLLMFGMVKFPPEMELSDIKNRQVRQNHPSMLFPVNRSSGTGKGSGSWRLLKALSCKDPASVAVTASFCVPHV
jgi:hypothetical protein